MSDARERLRVLVARALGTDSIEEARTTALLALKHARDKKLAIDFREVLEEEPSNPTCGRKPSLSRRSPSASVTLEGKERPLTETRRPAPAQTALVPSTEPRRSRRAVRTHPTRHAPRARFRHVRLVPERLPSGGRRRLVPRRERDVPRGVLDRGAGAVLNRT